MESAGETLRESEYDGLRDLKFRLSPGPASSNSEQDWWAVKPTTETYHLQRQQCLASSQEVAGVRSARQQG